MEYVLRYKKFSKREDYDNVRLGVVDLENHSTINETSERVKETLFDKHGEITDEILDKVARNNERFTNELDVEVLREIQEMIDSKRYEEFSKPLLILDVLDNYFKAKYKHIKFLEK